MTVLGCRTCGAALTVPVSKVALPVHAHQKYGNGPGSLEPALEPGTFAVDPLPYGSPWRPWAELEAGEAEALGWYAPRFNISDGPAGRVLLAPGDVRNAVIDPALVGDFGCCGLVGGEPNMVCVTCGTPVATRIDDCGLRQAVWLDPLTTRVIEDGPGPYPVLDWAELVDQRPGVPPSEPDGGWHPMWEAALGSTLAHLLAASNGDRILTPDPRLAGVFRRVLDRLLDPVGTGPQRSLVLAGPGLPAVSGDLAVVPEHPQTGEHWPVGRAVKPVPLAWDVWRHLAFHRDPKPVGRSVPILPEAPPALLPGYQLKPDGQIFLSVLARLPEVRQPWLRAIYERGHPYSYSYYIF
ncbi:hypothetical protein [Actinoplanes regularis]|uniref:Uncharacterized protein n=1 Tax=Actinoplanes regularis TaxID=52697 RepID=A0A238YUG9_9ACTN|nr:hypothetical protein [Actinoplanes regularis]GIE85574.1 hypothetical protein Are01nite_20540 [Actinoplanes regularis]SNR74787.1 hypothetical protein SAMN06264365_105197 [Actinoplanes regularis]